MLNTRRENREIRLSFRSIVTLEVAGSSQVTLALEVVSWLEMVCDIRYLGMESPITALFWADDSYRQATARWEDCPLYSSLARWQGFFVARLRQNVKRDRSTEGWLRTT